MKNILPIILFFALLLAVIPVLTTNSAGAQGSNGTQQESGNQVQQQLEVTLSSTVSQIQNQNQVKTQNEGEDSEIKTNTQNMSNVSEKVEELLTTEILQGSIGQQVKVIVQEQKTAQGEIQIVLNKVDSRGSLLKSIIGPDFKALKNMKKNIEQNQLRIQQLTQLQNELTSEGEIMQVKEMIMALTNQNTALQDKTSFEEQSSSLLGWLFKFFNSK